MYCTMQFSYYYPRAQKNQQPLLQLEVFWPQNQMEVNFPNANYGTLDLHVHVAEAILWKIM
jgi:hypothetical protein